MNNRDIETGRQGISQYIDQPIVNLKRQHLTGDMRQLFS